MSEFSIAVQLVAALDDAALITAAAAALAAAASAAIAAWQGVLMKRSERYRTQPIVVVYERVAPARHEGTTTLEVSLANEGAGPAFNVRFGVSAGAAATSYDAHPAGLDGAGDVPRALGAGRTLPEGGGTYRLALATTDEEALAARVYWCRYENAFGDTWQTRNAWRVDDELEIVSVDRPLSRRR